MPVKALTVLAAAAVLALPSIAAADPVHTVVAGESLTSIAAADGLSVAALAAANGLSPGTQLRVGQHVAIPASDSSTAAPASPGDGQSGAAESSASAGSYIVQPGDTLTAVAARDNTGVAQLAALNGLNPDGLLQIGAVLRLPVPGTGLVSATDPSSTTGTTGTTSAAAGASSPPSAAAGSGGPYPTDESVSGPEIGGAAAAGGVDPSLAQAIGWQESGDSNDVVSSAGAVGVMQIEPATWAWINQSLTPGAPLDPSSALDNVRAGVLLLHDLVAQTGSDTLAAAAYYQGLASLEQNGMYPSTRRYVTDVEALALRYGG